MFTQLLRRCAKAMYTMHYTQGMYTVSLLHCATYLPPMYTIAHAVSLKS